MPEIGQINRSAWSTHTCIYFASILFPLRISLMSLVQTGDSKFHCILRAHILTGPLAFTDVRNSFPRYFSVSWICEFKSTNDWPNSQFETIIKWTQIPQDIVCEASMYSIMENGIYLHIYLPYPAFFSYGRLRYNETQYFMSSW